MAKHQEFRDHKNDIIAILIHLIIINYFLLLK